MESALLSQVLANALITFSRILIVGAGFALLFRPTRAFIFSHAALLAVGAYTAYGFREVLGFPPLLAVLSALLACCALGAFLEVACYRPLRKRGSSPEITLLASLGVYIILQNAISLMFGDASRGISRGAVVRVVTLAGGRFTHAQLWILAAALGTALALHVIAQRTQAGRAFRAVCADAELASVSGVRSERVILSGVAVGSALAGLVGGLVAFDTNVTPTMGMQIWTGGLVAAVMARASVGQLVLAAAFLSVAEHAGTWMLGAQWGDVASLVVLIAFLMFRLAGRDARASL